MSNANFQNKSEQQRLLLLDKIEDKIKKQKELLKKIKDGTAEVSDKDKAIHEQVVKINKSLKEQKQLKFEISKIDDKHADLESKVVSYQEKIAKFLKTQTPEMKAQFEASGGIKDRSEVINNIAERSKNLSGDQSDIYAEIAELMMDVDELGIKNLESEKDIGKAGFQQLDLKEKRIKFQEIENMLKNASLKDTAIGEEKARELIQDKLDLLKGQIDL